MKKKSFIIRLENIEQFNMLTDEQCGKLLKAMCRYVDTGEVETFQDKIVSFAFSFLKGQIDRDTEKYEEMCTKNAENGKKGGRPRKSERFSEKPKKSERFFSKPTKSLCDSDSDSDPECDPEPETDPDSDSVCEPDCDTHAKENTAHTAQRKRMDWQGVLDLSKNLGYTWTKQEAIDFLAYNIDKGRTEGWGFAVQRWEANRPKREQRSGRSGDVTPEEQEKASKYLALANRFREDNGYDGEIHD